MIAAQEPAIIAACFAIVCVGAVTDIFTRKIPNLLTLGGLALGLVAHAVIGFVDGGAYGALRGFGYALLAGLLCALLPFFYFVRGTMGGGDVKLFAAIGAMIGLTLGLYAQGIMFVLLLVLVYPWMAVRSGLLRTKVEQFRAIMRGEKREPQAAIKLPRVILGPAILVGLCISLLQHGILSLS